MKRAKLLKFCPHLFFAALALLFVMSSANAGEGLQRVRKSQFSASMLARGLETYRGEIIGMRELDRPAQVLEVLSRQSIETKKGEIFYPEEIEFILIKDQKSRGDNERAPHADERIPHGDE